MHFQEAIKCLKIFVLVCNSLTFEIILGRPKIPLVSDFCWPVLVALRPGACTCCKFLDGTERIKRIERLDVSELILTALVFSVCTGVLLCFVTSAP